MLLLWLTLANKILALAPSCYIPELAPRIIGGTQASAREFPFLAEVRTGVSLCGGSLIAPGWILTAAHCGADYVVLGKYTLDAASDPCEERINVQARYPHPLYDALAHTNDIQLIKLETPSTYNPIKLWDGVGTTGAVGATLMVAGWGTLSQDSQTASNVLMKVSVPVQTNQKCSAQYGGNLITPTMLCAGLDAGGKDSCTGDSGGPLFARDTTAAMSFIQVAVVSFGMGCGQANAYGVYTRVTPYLDWICNTAGVCGAVKPTVAPPTAKATRAPTGFPSRPPSPAPTFRITPFPTPARIIPTAAPTFVRTAAPTPVPAPVQRAPTRPPTPPCRTCVWCLSFLPMCPAPTPARPAPTAAPPTFPPTLPPTVPPTAARQVMFPQPNGFNQQLGTMLGLQMLLGNRELDHKGEVANNDERSGPSNNGGSDNTRSIGNNPWDNTREDEEANNKKGKGKGGGRGKGHNTPAWNPPTPEPTNAWGRDNSWGQPGNSWGQSNERSIGFGAQVGAQNEPSRDPPALPASWGQASPAWGQPAPTPAWGQPAAPAWGQPQPPASWGSVGLNLPLGGLLG